MTAVGRFAEMVPKYEKPPIPAILTKKDWDKKKGVFAKVFSGKTGIGEQCEAVAKAYKSAKWADVDLNAQLLAKGFSTWKDDTFNQKNLAKVISAANKETSSGGSLFKLNQELHKLAKLCTDAETKFRKDSKIPKASAEHCKKMASEAAFLASSFSQNTYGGYAAKVEKAVQAWVQGAVVAQMLITQKTIKSKVEEGIQKVAKDARATVLNEFSTGAVRSLNQAIGNIAKYEERGFGKGNGRAYSAHFDVLQPLARGGLLSDSATPDEVKAEVKKMLPALDTGIKLVTAWKP